MTWNKLRMLRPKLQRRWVGEHDFMNYNMSFTDLAACGGSGPSEIGSPPALQFWKLHSCLLFPVHLPGMGILWFSPDFFFFFFFFFLNGPQDHSQDSSKLGEKIYMYICTLRLRVVNTALQPQSCPPFYPDSVCPEFALRRRSPSWSRQNEDQWRY